MATRSRNSLDELERRPLVGFFSRERFTDGRVNLGIVGLIIAIVVAAFLGEIHPAALVGAVALAVLLRRNWRRYRQRVFFALAERDRPPGGAPTHPDFR